jgi:membrane-bound serine protease (ClpP class)
MFQTEPWVMPTIGAVAGGIVAFVVYKVVRVHRRQPTTGREELKGKTAIVRTALKPEGVVFYNGELWTAILDDGGEAQPGDKVIITSTEGLKLHVAKNPKDKAKGK